MTKSHPVKKVTKERRVRRHKGEKELQRLVDEAVKKVVSEYGDVLRKLGKE